MHQPPMLGKLGSIISSEVKTGTALATISTGRDMLLLESMHVHGWKDVLRFRTWNNSDRKLPEGAFLPTPTLA